MTAIETSLLPTEFIQIQRRGDRLTIATSEDGKEWTGLGKKLEIRLPKALKVGVTAEATIEGAFKVVFDQFKLTPLGDKTR
jgi:regulation of enolase protein 1 (concanavalin A-like superfamily)